MHLRIFTAEANTGVGTHGRCIAEALKRVAPEKIYCEVIATNDQQAISLAIEKSEPSDVAIFFMPHHLQEELKGKKFYWTVFETDRPHPGYENWLEKFDHIFPFRTERISFARNTLFNEVKKIGSDYFCPMDLDGVIGDNFDVEGFLNNFGFDACWDAVFPANADKYYDIWTLRHEDLCPGDYEREMNGMDPVLSNTMIFDSRLNHLQNMDFKALNGWLQVSSAFGGMGIYKTSKFIHSNYFGVKDGYEVSDHVAFHLKAVDAGALLYINPVFLVNSKLGL